MTTAKPAPPKPDDEIELHSSIEELENLLADKEVTINTHPAIPVLDEEVDPDDDYPEADELDDVLEPEVAQQGGPDISQEQLQLLIDNLEEKLTGELDALVNILKDAIKDSIITEIKSQLENHTANGSNTKPGDKTST